MQAGGDPALSRTGFKVGKGPAGQGLGVHYDESRRIPQLVAEVAETLDASQVKTDIAPLCRQAREGKAQGLSAKGWDTVRKLTTRGFGDLFSHLRLH